MADQDATLRHSNSVNSKIDLCQTASNLSQDLSSHDETERSISHDREHLDPDIHKRLWTPFFLRRYILLSFIAFYLFIAVSLVVLLAIDRAQQGLASARTSQHYLWTYGPTAILTLAATLWGQVEYRAKQVMPWAVLWSGPTRASETLFIDYVSINQISALFKSFKARHFPVTLAVLGSLIIKLLIVISTSLLFLNEQPWRTSVRANSTEIFSSENWNNTGLTYGAHHNPMDTTVAIAVYNISYPPGTSEKQTIPNLDLNDLVLGDLDIAEADLPNFQANLDCETANLISSNITKSIDGFSGAHLTFQTSSCYFNDTVGWDNNDVEEHHFLMISSGSCYPTRNATMDDGEYYSFIYSGYFVPNTTNFRPYSAEAKQHGAINDSNVITILACKPTYMITSSFIRLDSRQELQSYPFSTAPSNSGNQLTNLDIWDIMSEFQAEMNQEQGWGQLLQANGTGMENVYLDRGADDDIEAGFLALIISERVEYFASLLDPQALQDAYTHFFQSAAAQIAKRVLLVPGTEEHKLVIHTTQQRLRVRTLSTYWALGILATLTILTAALCAVAPQRMISRDVGSLGGVSMILSRSLDLSSYLQSTGHVHLATIQDSVRAKWCKSHATNIDGKPRFRVDFYGEDNPSEGLQWQDTSTKHIRWWRPFAISAPHKLIVVASIASVIATLEVLCQRSRLESGFVEVNDQGAIRYAWLYIPVLTMITIQLLVGMISSASNIVLPYHEIRLWPSSGKKTLLDYHPSLLTIHALFNSIYQRHWAIVATSVSMLLNPFLTIAASGLYTAEHVPSTETIQLQVQDTLISANTRNSWVWDWDLEETRGAGFVTQLLIDDENMRYPPWTLHGLVFPKLSTLEEGNLHSKMDINALPEGQSTVRSRVSALRPSLNCSRLAGDDLNLKSKVSAKGIHTDIRSELQYPAGCKEDWSYWESGEDPESGQVKTIRPNHDGDSRAFCPDLLLIYGWHNRTPPVDVAMCDGFVEEVQVDTTFSLPSFKIMEATVDEKSTRLLENGSASLSLMEYTASYIPIGIMSPIVGMDYEVGTNKSYDPIFRMMFQVEGTHAIKMPDIMGEEGFPKLVETLEYYWRLMLPQHLNLHSREEIQGEKPLINGTLIHSDRYRLQQSVISTRILEVLLGIMGVCIAVSLWAMNTKEILPKNPCSIAAQASLLAGSSMLREDVIPPGSEWLSDKELLEKGVFAGLLFSMGWRGGVGDEKRWFGIDVGKSDWSK